MKSTLILFFLLLVSLTGNAQNRAQETRSPQTGWDSDETFVSGKPVAKLPRYGGICGQSTYTGRIKIVEGQECPIYIDGRDERTYYPIQKGEKWERKYFKKFKLPFLYVGE